MLIDAAGEFEGYCADVTRTYPINGKFTKMQRVVFDMVLAVQNQTWKFIKANENSWGALWSYTKVTLLQQLLQNQFVNGTVESLLNQSIYSLFMPHGLSHYIGLSVHDTSSEPASTRFQVGNAFTIEPGIYFIPGLLSQTIVTPLQRALINWTTVQPYLDANFGGVRIEDDFVIAPNGTVVRMSTGPHNADEIEKVMAKNSTNPQHKTNPLPSRK